MRRFILILLLIASVINIKNTQEIQYKIFQAGNLTCTQVNDGKIIPTGLNLHATYNSLNFSICCQFCANNGIYCLQYEQDDIDKICRIYYSSNDANFTIVPNVGYSSGFILD